MSSPAALTHDSRGPIRILLADTDSDARDRYRAYLQLAGCDVVDAGDGRDALVKAFSHRPTLVVTDTRLPLIDGYALCQVLRRDPTTRTVPILVVTSEKGATELERARDAGADEVLIKPITPDALLNEIQRLIREPGDHRTTPSPTQTPPRERRKTLAKAHSRFDTTTPPSRPPDVFCPSCDAPLTYGHSHIGGVNHRFPEQWDYYACPASCGTFVYRHRTRRLRRAV